MAQELINFFTIEWTCKANNKSLEQDKNGLEMEKYATIIYDLRLE